MKKPGMEPMRNNRAIIMKRKNGTNSTGLMEGPQPIQVRMKRTALSLFSGAGGMDIGVLSAGFEILACVEFDPNCCATLRLNIGKENRMTRVIHADIRAIDPAMLMRELGLQPGELDLLFGGPPCQAFSQIGKQEALKDERGLLLFQMTRFAEVFQPKAIFIEQVKGLLSAKDKRGERGEVYHMLLSHLKRLGYDPRPKVLRAVDYGVAQLRQRVFIVSTKPPNGFEFPAPTHGPEEEITGLFPLDPYVTVGQVLNGLPPPSLKGIERQDSHVDVTPKGDRSRIHGVPEGGYLANQIHLPDSQRGKLSAKDTTKYLRVSRTRPPNTLRCGEIFFHPTEDRYLSPREYMRIHGYPDTYLLAGPIRSRSGRVRELDQHRQIANSVPPPLARIVAIDIDRVLGCHKSLKFSATR